MTKPGPMIESTRREDELVRDLTRLVEREIDARGLSFGQVGAMVGASRNAAIHWRRTRWSIGSLVRIAESFGWEVWLEVDHE